MQIKEIFNSIGDEGLTVGDLTTYIRVFGCNLNCVTCNNDYCVNPQSDADLTGFTVMEVEQILERVANLDNKHVTVCGGEPLLQRDMPELIAGLLDEGYIVNLETQGAVELDSFEKRTVDILDDDSMLNNLIYSVDYKCPSSTMTDRMITSNISFLIDTDAMRFHVQNTEDLEFMKQVVENNEPQAHVFVIPINNFDCKDVINFINSNNIQKARVQLPLRKVIYGNGMYEG